MNPPADSARTIAVYIDLENVAIGVREAKLGKFEIDRVFRRLLDKGNLVVRRAYANWESFSEYRRPLHEAGVELFELPGSKLTGKNSADIRLVVDALELAHTKPHIDSFALVTGDSDFHPLVAKLRENAKYTIGIGVKQSTSKLLIDACDEFIYYDDLVTVSSKRPVLSKPRLSGKKRQAFELLIEASEALLRDNKELHSSLVKDTMKRKQPQFNEEYYGYRSFNRLLEDAAAQKIIEIRRDERSGTYVIADILADTD